MAEDLPTIQAAIDLGADVRVGWRLKDPTLEADAKALWARLALLPDGVDPDMRADEIIAGAYVDGQLAGVSTAFVRELPFLRSKFAMMRVSVAPEFRLNSISRLLSYNARQVLEKWSVDHPEEEIAGMATVHQADLRNGRKSSPLKRASKMVLVGFTPQGEKILVAWFDHVLI